MNGTFWAANEFGVGSNAVFDAVGDPADDIVNFSPNVDVFAYMSGTTLEIPGLGNSANNLTVGVSGGIYSVTDIISGNPVTDDFSAAAVHSINMTLGSGANTVSYGAGNLSGMASAHVGLGSGHEYPTLTH